MNDVFPKGSPRRFEQIVTELMDDYSPNDVSRAIEGIAYARQALGFDNYFTVNSLWYHYLEQRAIFLKA